MAFVKSAFLTAKDYLTSENKASLSGAIDIICVEGDDGVFRCSPFHVRFGTLQGVTKPKEKVVQITVNGVPVEGMLMKLGPAGEAFFVEQSFEPVDEDYMTSPVSSPTTTPLAGAPTMDLAALDAQVSRGGSVGGAGGASGAGGSSRPRRPGSPTSPGSDGVSDGERKERGVGQSSGGGSGGSGVSARGGGVGHCRRLGGVGKKGGADRAADLDEGGGGVSGATTS